MHKIYEELQRSHYLMCNINGGGTRSFRANILHYRQAETPANLLVVARRHEWHPDKHHVAHNIPTLKAVLI